MIAPEIDFIDKVFESFSSYYEFLCENFIEHNGWEKVSDAHDEYRAQYRKVFKRKVGRKVFVGVPSFCYRTERLFQKGLMK